MDTFSTVRVQRTAGQVRVTFDRPPINLIGRAMIADLRGVVDELEADTETSVVVFDSADPEFFLAHWDLAEDPSEVDGLPVGPTGQPAWLDLLIRLSRLPQLTIAALAGRARGAGSEFALACDVRFASDSAVISQWEVGVGTVPGGGPSSRLARLVGRGRALEILVGGDDFDGATAERYGYVNRSLPDAEFSSFVDHFAARVSHFDPRAISEIKDFVDPLTLPPDDEFPAQFAAFWTSIARPESQNRLASLVERGLQQRGDTELHLGAELARLRDERRPRRSLDHSL